MQERAYGKRGFYWDWRVAPQWNLCDAPGIDEPRGQAMQKLIARLPTL